MSVHRPEVKANPGEKRAEARSAGMPDQRLASSTFVAVDNLRKRYGKTIAVDGVSFSVAMGEAFGLLGPNGAGKTTTIEMMVGLTRPDGGDVIVGGASVRTSAQAVQRQLGIVPQGLAVYEDLTARQNLTYFARLRGISGLERRRQIDEILELVGLTADSGRKVAGFSGGMKRRLNIGIGLLGRPKALLLDEPTVGIDPQSRRHILDSVRRLADEGMTIIYTSHYMEEVEYLCTRVAIMDHGRIIAQGPIDDVKALAGDSVVLRLPVGPDDLGEEFDFQALRQAVAVPVETVGGEMRFLLPEGSQQAPELLNTLQRFEVPLDGMRLDVPNLETVFLSLTGKALRDHPTDGGGAQS